MVTGNWAFGAFLRSCSCPQNSMMGVHTLVGVLIMVGFVVGKRKWGPRQGAQKGGGGGAVDAQASCQAEDLK